MKILNAILLLILVITAMPAHAQYTAATVNTLGPTNILDTSALLRGECTELGSGTAKVYIAWGLEDGTTNAGDWDNNDYVDTLTYARSFWLAVYDGLTQNTTYYFRAWASNIAGVSWATGTVSFTTLPTTPTSLPPIGLVLVAADTNGNLVTPGNFFTANGIVPTNDLADLLAKTDHGTNSIQIAAVLTSVGSCLTGNPDMTNDAAWAAVNALWNSLGDGCFLVNAGDSGTISPSNSIGWAAGMTVLIQYSNSLPSTGSVVISGGGWTNGPTAIEVGTVSFLAYLTESNNLTFTIHATNGQTQIDGIRVYQVLEGDGHFAGNVTAGGLGAFAQGVRAPAVLGATNVYIRNVSNVVKGIMAEAPWGAGNTCNADYGFCGGIGSAVGPFWSGDPALQRGSSIGWGEECTIENGAMNARIDSGYRCIIGQYAHRAWIGGGSSNEIADSGVRAWIPSGEGCFATNYAGAAGRRAKATNPGSLVLGDSRDVDKLSVGQDTFRLAYSGGGQIDGIVSIVCGPGAGGQRYTYTTNWDADGGRIWERVEHDQYTLAISAASLAGGLVFNSNGWTVAVGALDEGDDLGARYFRGSAVYLTDAWLRVSAPTGATATGSARQASYFTDAGLTNWFCWYDENAAGSGTGRWCRVEGSRAW